MKTVTTYAEKKAKQFLNLLQGYTKGIRITAILILLLMGVSNAWAYNQSAVDLYFDNSEAKWSSCYVYIGHSTWTSCYPLTRVSGTQYLWKLAKADFNGGSSWNNATGWVLCYEKWWDSNGESIDKYTWHGAKNVTKKRTSAWSASYIYKTNGTVSVTSDGNTINAYNTTTVSNKNYTVTINTVEGGILTVKDYDNNAVATGASKIYLTVLKFSASASTGYTFGGVQINNGSTTTTISAADIASKTYTLTSNVTITPIWTEKTYSVTISAGSGGTVSPSGSKTIGQVTKTTVTATPNANYEFVNWTATGGVVVANTSSVSTTITATAAGTLTANFRSTATKSLTVAAGAGIASVTGSTDPVELGSPYTITATPKTGYTFSTWTANPVANATFGSATTANTTVTVKNGSVTVTASATENMSTLTTSNKYDAGDPGYEVPAASVNSIGYETTATITATTDDDYTLTSWTLTNCTRTDGGADNATTITVRSNGDGKAATVTANYTENPCVYFVNTARWTTINIYAWASSDDQNKNGNWPGKAMTKETEKISGYDVYKYVMPAGKTYDKIIFNNKVGDNGDQTGDLDWVNGKYYVYSAEQWVDKNEVADLLPKPVIYFKNNPGWKDVYVYFLTSDNWDGNSNGGASSSGLTEANGRVCKMEKVGETDIYKYDYEASGIVPGNVIAFTKDKQANYGRFHNTEAAYRSDYNSGMELYIPQKTSSETKNGTKYYNKGLWMKYNSTESGYSITGTINNWDHNADKFTANSLGGYHFEAEVLLDGGKDYVLKIKNIKNDWFSTATVLTSTKNTDVEFITEHGNDAKLTTTSDGYYTFSIDLSEGKMMVSVEYPLQVNDYRLVYVESEVSGKTPYTKFHPAQSIHYQATGEKKDTVSFYINKTTGKNPAILLQQCTNISGANITWKDVAIQNINGNGGATPTAALAPAKRAGELYVGGGSDITTNGVYNFTLSQTDGTAKILNEETHPYEGDYYIRTDAADGGWRKYNTNPDNIMTHSQTALKHGGYDYYFCKWALENTNVHYVVANKYSYCVSDTLKNGDFTNNEGKIPHNANVRYTWDSSTNKMSRAYINGSGDVKDRYLILEGDANIKDIEGHTFNITGLNANEANFKDMGNWLYQLEVKANSNAKVKLTANYNGTKQYFKGGEGAEEKVSLITGATKDYKLRLVYDFKTNYLISALIDDTEIDENLKLDEVMIIRSHHDDANTIQVAKSKGSVTAIQTIYGVMTFNKTTLNDNTKSQYERALYWVSFPFDVDLGEAFGFGNYGEHWIMEYYDGEERAKNGAWVDSDTYWKYIMDPKGYKLKAGEGYVLCLDLDLLHNDASVFHHSDEIALYFPSLQQDDPLVIANAPTTNTTNVTAHTCEINRPTPDGDRRIKDSNWNIIGIPCYTDIDNSTIGKLGLGNLQFLYQYNANNTYTAQAATNFNTMHAYMVQYAGDINWINLYVEPAQMAARRNATGKDQYTLRLALQQEGTDHDHTFIRLQEDNATAEFDMNYDLCKIINRGANIYSMINNVEVAANVLPVEERVIPIGLDIHETGNYTFAMPDGTDGITAILIDYETGKETNLLLADYTTELREGTNNERFALRVRPNHVATEVETIIDGANGQIQKYIINGALYILNNGQLYDAQGRMVQP